MPDAVAPKLSTVSAALEQLRLRMGTAWDAELQSRRDQLAAIAPEAAHLVDELEGYVRGGKLLRPRFCLFGGLSALAADPSEEQLDQLARAGMAIELVQAAALMHDDVIDHSPTRRGRPALHVAESVRHARSHLTGSSEDFGIATAIVLGDLALTWSEDAAADVFAVGGESAQRARGEFQALRTEVMSGQYLDILHQAGGFRSASTEEEAALEVIRWKTVPYTVLRPLRMGAALMGADDQRLDQLSAWAVEVGTAFQLRDDLLSVLGDEDATGKPVGGDIVEGKRTVLLARTAARADASGTALLERVVGSSSASAQDLAAVHQLMRDTGAVAQVAQEVRDRAGRARELLAALPACGIGVEGLSALADAATELESLGL